jgi:hypothetical protein
LILQEYVLRALKRFFWEEGTGEERAVISISDSVQNEWYHSLPLLRILHQAVENWSLRGETHCVMGMEGHNILTLP